ncbi:FkbM family methyltransferase [Cryomorpha ignava]|uniref:FkbM family methyltransferase n=1 Tax=Cryomorpha ignava TaxID=101383 RepID=A0A7K3WRD1_9FLAO|nr:FkbM family methyltransferase [Cryomorpha ignava]NEN24233.1 FkbM family methyltransferase [Cryomorpha ignava]
MLITRVIYPLSLRDRVSYKLNRFYKHLNTKDVTTLFGKNVKMDLLETDFGHRRIIMNGFYELGLSREIHELAQQGGVLFDVGANYGYYSCIWASANSENKVHAFEASPKNVDPLTNNISKNDLSPQVVINQLAMGKEKGKLRFNLALEKNQSGWGGLTIDENTESVEVDVNTLDNYTADNGIERIDVLKIDTEGADTWVLYGAERLLKEKRIKHIHFEVNLPRMKLLKISPDDAPKFLESVDYKVKKISESDFYAYPG